MPFRKIAHKINPFSQIIFSPLWFIQFLYLIVVSFLIIKSNTSQYENNILYRDIVGFFTPLNILYIAIIMFIINLCLYKYWHDKRAEDLNPFAFLNLVFLICVSVVWYESIIDFINLRNI